MDSRAADIVVHSESAEDEDIIAVSVDLIDPRLYLGNLASAKEISILQKLQITHILTIDLVPLSRSLLDRANVNFNFIKLADVPNEDLLSHLPEALQYIKNAINNGGNVLVHCYFGVSRSAAVTIAYIMEKYSIQYETAFGIVKAKRRFIGPNSGFVSQLKLFGNMNWKLDRDNRTYKQFRLKMAGQKLKQVKILPQLFADLIKPDPGLVRERPDPIVYRCKKCRRVVASQSNIIPHIPKEVRVEMARRGLRPPPSNMIDLESAESGKVLIEKLKTLACRVLEGEASSGSSPGDAAFAVGPSHLDGYNEQNLVDCAISSRVGPNACRLMWFVEPMSWMARVSHDQHGKLHCPKCQSKIGSFSWVSGCRCPCGQKVAPAFYLVPSKVEWSNIVQNVQVTV